MGTEKTKKTRAKISFSENKIVFRELKEHKILVQATRFIGEAVAWFLKTCYVQTMSHKLVHPAAFVTNCRKLEITTMG
jgi:hypothetical protein